jgi:hypothetical protein
MNSEDKLRKSRQKNAGSGTILSGYLISGQTSGKSGDRISGPILSQLQDV